MEAIIGKVVAFVVAQGEPGEDSFPETVVEFGDPKEALAHSGVYFKKIRRPDGGFSYDPGFHEEMRVGDEMYGYPCSECKVWTWWHRRSVSEATHAEHCRFGAR